MLNNAWPINEGNKNKKIKKTHANSFENLTLKKLKIKLKQNIKYIFKNININEKIIWSSLKKKFVFIKKSPIIIFDEWPNK